MISELRSCCAIHLAEDDGNPAEHPETFVVLLVEILFRLPEFFTGKILAAETNVLCHTLFVQANVRSL